MDEVQCYLISNATLTELGIKSSEELFQRSNEWWSENADEAYNFEEFVAAVFEKTITFNSFYKIF